MNRLLQTLLRLVVVFEAVRAIVRSPRRRSHAPPSAARAGHRPVELFPSTFDEWVPDEPDTAARGEGLVVASFGLTIAAAVGLVVAYLLSAQTQILGLLAATAFFGLSFGLTVWAKLGLANPTVVEDRELMTDSPDDTAHLLQTLRRGTSQLGRRTAIIGGLGAALAAFAVPVVGLISSLGPTPGNALQHTAWRRGSRLVDSDGNPVRPDDLPLEAAVPVFPEGSTAQQRSRSQAVLLHVPPDVVASQARDGAVDGGLVAYSRLCTHAGCAVSLFQGDDLRPDDVHQLMCPCHQSLFSVERNCAVVAGPAPRPLPQLPIDVDAEGYLVARGDFGVPVGPGFWERS